MPSPIHRFGRKVKALFRGRSRDTQRPSTGNPNFNRSEGVGEATASSSAPPPAAAGIPMPALIAMPATFMADLDTLPTDGDQHKLLYPSDTPVPLKTRAFGGGKGGQVLDGTFSPKSTSTSSRKPPIFTLGQTPVSGARPQDQDLFSSSPATGASTSYFPNAHGFHVQDRHFTTNLAPSKTLFEYLNPHMSHGSVHDSDERCDAPSCHEETRIAIREEIIGWIKHGDEDGEPKKIMWMSGPAGAGKTAIAGSVAERCKKEGLLTASFFFSSLSPSTDRRSKRGLVATLAYHISQNKALHQFKAHLHTAVEGHPEVFHRNLKEQAECLILGPFRMIHDREARETWPKVIIIDGLDEIVAAQPSDPTKQRIPRTSEDDQVEVLEVLLALSQSSSFPFRIFVASRPETNISDFFATKAQDSTISLFLDSKFEPDADIHRYLEAKFANIRRRAGISGSWPGQPALGRLVDMSSGQFIVPVTIIRWVESGLPQRQLADVLQLDPVDVKKKPFATLDALYHHILKRANDPDDDPRFVVKWIHCITSAMSTTLSTDPPPVQFWRQFLEDEEGELRYRLAPISSLISVPPSNDGSSPITVYHKSLIDFLTTPTRCSDFYVKKTEHESFVADRILGVLKHKGPIVPLSAPADLAKFLTTFFNLNVFFTEYPGVLAPLRKCSQAELASCDVAWWTTVSLVDLHFDGSGLPHDGKIKKPFGPHCRVHPALVRGIYKSIHHVMECDSNTPSSTQDMVGHGPGPNCHAACIHWRTGILVKAKELRWCVHELEQVQLDGLHNLTMGDVQWRFREAWHLPCAICQPSSTII